jgi:hypothetical protein
MRIDGKSRGMTWVDTGVGTKYSARSQKTVENKSAIISASKLLDGYQCLQGGFRRCLPAEVNRADPV